MHNVRNEIWKQFQMQNNYFKCYRSMYCRNLQVWRLCHYFLTSLETLQSSTSIYLLFLTKANKGLNSVFIHFVLLLCDTLRDLLLFVLFEKCEKTDGGVLLLVKLQASYLIGQSVLYNVSYICHLNLQVPDQSQCL